MSRVSEGSTVHAIKHSVGKTKSKLEALQLKGSNLKRVSKPSDDPMGNMEILSIRSRKQDSNQYQRNASVAKAQLTLTENAITELTEIMTKAKEIAISQASNLFDKSIRQSVAKEIKQLRDQAISIANRRMGNKYIFSGHKSLTRPINKEGEYQGDTNQTKVEVSKDFFVPISFNGKDLFFEKVSTRMAEASPLQNTALDKFEENIRIQKDDVQIDLKDPVQPEEQNNGEEFKLNRTPANLNNPNAPAPQNLAEARSSIFSDLQRLYNAISTDNHEIVQEILPALDSGLDRLIESRAKIGSIINSIDSSIDTLQKDEIVNEEYKSKIEDADIGELFSDLTRQQNVLNATYKASAKLMNQNLMDYIR